MDDDGDIPEELLNALDDNGVGLSLSQHAQRLKRSGRATTIVKRRRRAARISKQEKSMKSLSPKSHANSTQIESEKAVQESIGLILRKKALAVREPGDKGTPPFRRYGSHKHINPAYESAVRARHKSALPVIHTRALPRRLVVEDGVLRTENSAVERFPKDSMRDFKFESTPAKTKGKHMSPSHDKGEERSSHAKENEMLEREEDAVIWDLACKELKFIRACNGKVFSYIFEAMVCNKRK